MKRAVPQSPGVPLFQWNPADYAANSASQHAWARELISRLHLRGDERILDVGCGDGKVTAELARAVPRGGVLGIDSSTEMIAYARAQHAPADYPHLEFAAMDARQIRLAPRFDVVFSNAALHWVDDHEAFLAGAAAALAPGGRLMISCGGRGNARDVFIAIRAVMRRAEWREFFRRMQPAYFFYRPEDYRTWLSQLSLHADWLTLTEKDLAHHGRDAYAAWIRTTWLPYTQRVPNERRDAFVNAVVERYLDRHPPDAAGWVHVRMVRLEIAAVKLCGKF